MRLLVRLFATSEFLSAFFLRHPELLDSLVRADLVRIERPADEMAADLRARLAAAPDLEAELDTLRRFRHEEFLRIGVHDIEGTLEPDGVAAQLTALAETCLRAALGIARREVLARSGLPDGAATDGLAVVAMGKLGSGELSYASDLDLIFVYEGGGQGVVHEAFTRIAQRAISALQTPTREGIAYRIDTRLRPSGNQGPLVTSLDAFEGYHRTSAQVWERQALIKARVVADRGAAARLDAIIARFVYGRGLESEEAAEIARMRTRIERERGAADAASVNVKTGRGGARRRGVPRPDAPAAARTCACGRPDARHGAGDRRARGRRSPPRGGRGALAAGHRFLRTVESRLRLEHDQPVDAVDASALAALARRLGYEGDDATIVAALRADQARHGDAIRAVYDRPFANAAG
jgi:glutamate-ammonia-ligase adenylyltransferase